MKIVHVITRLIVGGAQENTLLSCAGLANKGHDVLLLAGPETGPEGSLWEMTKTGRYQSQIVPHLCRAISPWADACAVAELTRRLKDFRPDVVHTHSSKAGILGRWAAAHASVPCIVHTIHGMSFNRTQSRWVQSLYRFAELAAAEHTHRFIAVAHAMVDQSVAAGIAPRSAFTMIRSGMRTDQFRPSPQERASVRNEWQVDDDDIVVGTVARLFPNKGYEQIIELIPRLVPRNPRLRFVWIGQGPNQAQYANRLAELEMIDRVRMIGLVPPTEIPRCMNGFDLLLHASRWEGLPRCAVQALLTEVPVVSFDNDGAPEIVIPQKTGAIAPVDDIHALGQSVLALADQPDLRRQMGRLGRQICLAEFDADTMVDQLHRLYLDGQASI